MALDTRLTNMPEWMQAKDWQSAALTTQRLLETGLRKQQADQQMALQLRGLSLREQQQTYLNQVRLEQLNEAERQLRDVAKLRGYAKNPDAGIPDLEDPSSFSKLGAIDLARARSEVGRQTIADQTDFNRRLGKVSAADRAAIRDLQKQGRPESELWDVLSGAEQRIGDTKTFAPDALQKALDSAKAAESAGNTKEAALWWERASTIARGGKAPAEKSGAASAKTDEATATGKSFNFPGLVKRLFGAKPETPSAGETNVTSIIEQANAAIMAGKDPVAVRARLKKLGIEFEEQGVAPEELKDALSQQVQGALEAKPIAP